MLPRARYIRDFFEAFEDHPSSISLETLLAFHRETFDALAPLYAGLSPAHADRMVERLAGWAEYVALRERVAERARRHIAAHRERGHLNALRTPISARHIRRYLIYTGAYQQPLRGKCIRICPAR
jgi:2-oxoglutarate dehydrogenase complex dehydrogenase (E1) component-like enzyme